MLANPWIALTVVALGYFMNVLDSTAVNVAVPNIAASLDASAGEILWVLNGYIFPFAMLLLLGGRLGDLLGHRNVFFAGLLVFTVTSLMCALADSPEALIVARVLQGIGAALAAPQALAITAAVFPPERRAMAFGVLASVIGSAAAAAPILGGVLIDLFGWRSIFYLNLPIGVLGLLATFAVLPATRDRQARGVSLGATLLVSAGLFAALYALIEGQRYDWGAVWGPIGIPQLLVLGVVLLGVFFFVERSRQGGLLPRATFTSRNYALMLWASIATYFGIFGTQLVMTIYLQAALGVGPLQAGLVLCPMWVAASLVAPVAGRLAGRLSGRSLLATGFTVFAFGAALTGLLAWLETPWWSFMLPLIVAGAGAGLTFAPVSMVAMQEITPDAFGRASGLIEVVRQVGAAVCIAVVGAVMQAVWLASLRDGAASASQDLSPAGAAAVSEGVERLADQGLNAGSAAVVDTGSPAADSVLSQVSVDSLVAAAGPALLITAFMILTAVAASLLVRGTEPRPAEAAVPSTAASTAD
ncbi:DHA2 family efflux MFS transporter permease subunit [Actinoplanes sp. NPDC051346]|uniref:DHA2 family efflux MFS transporter permease subunit n=1 Tax=Actinoplanes sp. NPDC051346 TaxID=3155048 RepID=UPI00341BF5C1